MKKIDMHCHILPGIDDGSANPKETLAMLRMALNQDFVGMIVTPHGSVRNASVERVQEFEHCVRSSEFRHINDLESGFRYFRDRKLCIR